MSRHCAIPDPKIQEEHAWERRGVYSPYIHRQPKCLLGVLCLGNASEQVLQPYPSCSSTSESQPTVFTRMKHATKKKICFKCLSIILLKRVFCSVLLTRQIKAGVCDAQKTSTRWKWNTKPKSSPLWLVFIQLCLFQDASAPPGCTQDSCREYLTSVYNKSVKIPMEKIPVILATWDPNFRTLLKVFPQICMKMYL